MYSCDARFMSVNQVSPHFVKLYDILDNTKRGQSSFHFSFVFSVWDTIQIFYIEIKITFKGWKLLLYTWYHVIHKLLYVTKDFYSNLFHSFLTSLFQIRCRIWNDTKIHFWINLTISIMPIERIIYCLRVFSLHLR